MTEKKMQQKAYFLVSLPNHFGNFLGELVSAFPFSLPFDVRDSSSSNSFATPSISTASFRTSPFNELVCPPRFQLNINNVLAANPASRIVCSISFNSPLGNKSTKSITSKGRLIRNRNGTSGEESCSLTKP